MSALSSTLKHHLDRAARDLAAAGLEDPRAEARALFAALLGGRSALLDGERRLDAATADRLAAAVARRAAREPLGRILGRREFWSLDFTLTPATLEPRPDSETLVQAVLDRLPERHRPRRLLDLGTGSGCLLLALLSELPAAWGLGLDIAPQAATTAAANARSLGLGGRAAFLVDDWGRALSGGFEVVLSNPPYIASADLPQLAPEVRCHDPARALDGGSDGLAAYRRLLPEAARLLLPGGLLALEIGHEQGPAVTGLAASAGFQALECLADLAGRPRVVLGRRPPI